MIRIKRYSGEYKNEWDNLITSSKVDTFLFYRDFMDYHSSRFIDCSFMVYRKGKLQAVLPGNIENSTFYTHQGLTYGGIVSTQKFLTNDIISLFNILNKELVVLGINEVVYKPIPYIYQLYPGQEDIYALFRLGAKKIGCNISSTIYQNNKIKFNESRKSGIRKALKEDVIITESEEFNEFWKLLDKNLKENHNTKPVHNITEIVQLKYRFPEQIKLFSAKIQDKIVGGTVIFIMKNVVHVQYISANEKGKLSGALDLLFDELINHIFTKKIFFDFGQSTEQMGNYLNENLIFQKEGFGGRGVVYDIYKYSL